MRYLALASDYHSILPHDGALHDQTVRLLEHLTRSCRKLILVTGRELGDFTIVFPRLDLCEHVIAENGAVLYNLSTRDRKRIWLSVRQKLHREPSKPGVNRNRGVNNVSVGDIIVAT